MIALEDIITCESYVALCDYDYDPAEPLPPSSIVHVPMDHIKEFFDRIRYTDNRYVVVSSRSDLGLYKQEEHPVWKDMIKWVNMQVNPDVGYNDVSINVRCNRDNCRQEDKYSIKCHAYTTHTLPSIPKQVSRWFATNLGIPCSSRLTAIPFGIYMNKAEDLFEAMQHIPPVRTKKVYCSWQDYTYERFLLREYISTIPESVIISPNEPEEYTKYLRSLAQYEWVVSPPGNGADCYRTLEAMYMGSTVIVADTQSNRNLNISMLAYNNPTDIKKYVDKNIILSEYPSDFPPGMKLSYWKDQFKQAKKDMYVT